MKKINSSSSEFIGATLHRYNNLQTLIRQRGSQVGLLNYLNDRLPDDEQISGGPMSHLVTKTRGMGADIARRIERVFHMQPGAMDLPNFGRGSAPDAAIDLSLNYGVAPGSGEPTFLPRPNQAKISTSFPDVAAFAVQITCDFCLPRLRRGEIIVLSPNTEAEAGDLVALELIGDGPKSNKLVTLLSRRHDHLAWAEIANPATQGTVDTAHVEWIIPIVAVLIKPSITQINHIQSLDNQ